MYLIKYQILLHIITCNLYIINYKINNFVTCKPRSTPPLLVDESLHQYMEDGSTYSSIRDPCGILCYIPLRPHHDQLATNHLSRREMATRDTSFMYPSER